MTPCYSVHILPDQTVVLKVNHQDGTEQRTNEILESLHMWKAMRSPGAILALPPDVDLVIVDHSCPECRTLSDEHAILRARLHRQHTNPVSPLRAADAA